MEIEIRRDSESIIKNAPARLQLLLERAIDLFHVQMNRQTSACIYGSAASDDWNEARSDLDLMIFAETNQLDIFEQQLKKWRAEISFPMLDGFLLFVDQKILMAKRLDDPESRPAKAFEEILIPDQWKVKSRSIQLFGTAPIHELFPDIQSKDLSTWATANKKSYWIPSIRGALVKLQYTAIGTTFDLTPAIWMASGTARILTLERGHSCISKQEALAWLIDRYSDSKNLIQPLIAEYSTPDQFAKKLNVEEMGRIASFCLDLLKRISDDNGDSK